MNTLGKLSAIALACSTLTLGGCYWENALKTEKVEPERLTSPKDAADLVDIIKRVNNANARVKMTGSGHAHSDVAITKEVLLNPYELNKPLPLDRSQLKDPNNQSYVRTQSGIPLRQLNPHLASIGRNIMNMGGYDAQTIVGAAMTGTHGSGLDFGPIADQIMSMQVVDQRGNMLQVEPTNGITNPAKFKGKLTEDSGISVRLIQDDKTFNAMKVSLGSIGIVYSVVLETDQKFWLNELRTKTTWNTTKAPGGYLHRIMNGLTLRDNKTDPEYYELLVNPYSTRDDGDYNVLITERFKSYAPLPEQDPFIHRGKPAAELGAGVLTVFSPLVAEVIKGSPHLAPGIIDTSLDTLEDTNGYSNISYKVFHIGVVNETKALAIELAFDVSETVAAVERMFEIARDLKDRGLVHTGPVSLRFVKASNAHIAMMNGRDTMMLEIIMLQNTNEREVFETYQEAFINEFDARPHWGLDLNYIKGTAIPERIYPQWNDWMDVFNTYNSTGRFDGKFTDRLGISHGRVNYPVN